MLFLHRQGDGAGELQLSGPGSCGDVRIPGGGGAGPYCGDPDLLARESPVASLS